MDAKQKNTLIWVGIVVLIITVLGISLRIPKSDASIYAEFYKEQKIKYESLEHKYENLQQEVREKTGEVERLKADLQGGRTASEERLGLEKREQELTRREKLLNKREEYLESRANDFHLTDRSTGEKLGQATQIEKDYKDTKQRLEEVKNSIKVWEFFSLGALLIILGIAGLWIFKSIRKLKNYDNNIEKLQSTLRNSSVSVEEVRSVVDAFTQLSNQTSKALPPSNKSEEAAT